MSDVVLFGTGNWYNKYKSLFNNENIVALLDNSVSKQNREIDGLKVYHPQSIHDLRYDYVCIMAGYHYALEMMKQLVALGIDENRIFTSPADYFSWNNEKNIKIISERNIEQNEVVYLSASLFNGGGVRAGVFLIKSLKELYDGVTVICPDEGDVKQELLELGVSLIISPDVSIRNPLIWKYISERKLVWVNSIYYGYLIDSVKKIKGKVVWWLHNGESAWKNYYFPVEGFDTGEICVLGVSEAVRDAYLAHNPQGKMEILPWYIDDCPAKKTLQTNSKDRIVFAMIGTFDKVKAQDIFMQAISQIDGKQRERMEFVVIGQEFGTRYSEDIHSLYDEIKEIKWLGTMDHADVLEIYSKIDVLVCPSREDMLPLVCAEAMMNSIPCIMSAGVGMTSYVRDGKDALLFETENYAELSERMIWCEQNREKLMRIGKRGRKVYEKNFTREAFSQRLGDLL